MPASKSRVSPNTPASELLHMSKHPFRTAPDPKETGWPGGVPYIIGNEGCERFSFYGMKAILYVYVGGLYMNLLGFGTEDAERNATQVVHLFNSAVYAFPIIGAILADRLLGKYYTIVSLSIVYCLGHLALAVFESGTWQESLFGHVYIDPRQGLYLGLTLIGIGSGGIKPCVSAHVGDQFGPGNWHLLQKVFNAFYFIINFGSAFATIIIPRIRGERIVTPEGLVEYTGSVSWAFGIPGILMGLATIFFWMGRHKFIHVQPTHPGIRGLLDVLAGSALFMVIGIPIFGHDLIHSWFWIGVASASCLALFVILFAIRQNVEEDDGFMAILFYCFRVFFTGREKPATDAAKSAGKADDEESWLVSNTFFGPAVRHYGLTATEGPVAVLKIMCVFIFVSVFWALFDQHASTWIKQAGEMDRNVDFSLPGYIVTGVGLGLIVGGAFTLTIQAFNKVVSLAVGIVIGAVLGGFAWKFGPDELLPSEIPATNPFMVMVLIPYTTFGLYPLMRRLGFEPTPLRRMSIGMFTAGLAFVAVAIIQTMLNTGVNIHVAWQLIPYGIITLAEVMISITGLEFAYSQAPNRMKSVIMGFWLLNVTLGNVLVVVLAGFQGLALVVFFWVFAGLMGLAAGLFTILAMFYRYKDYTQ